jgi:hypothetical protein
MGVNDAFGLESFDRYVEENGMPVVCRSRGTVRIGQ